MSTSLPAAGCVVSSLLRFAIISGVLHWARTHEVLDRWALDLPTGVWATGGVGGPDLDFDSSIRSLSPLLPIQYARQTVTINWPAPEKPSGAGSGNGAHRSGKARLNKLRISTRYAGVDGATAGFHRSSTMQAKIDAEYGDSGGVLGSLPQCE